MSHYPPDTGCEVSPSCLNCPLPKCKHDDPMWYLDWKRSQRRKLTQDRILELDSTYTKRERVHELSQELKVSIRQAYRILSTGP